MRPVAANPLQQGLTVSAPILDDIRTWAMTQLSLEPPGCEYRRACNYLLEHEAALHRILEDGALPLDNNEAERSVRGVAQGRKSWLFAAATPAPNVLRRSTRSSRRASSTA